MMIAVVIMIGRTIAWILLGRILYDEQESDKERKLEIFSDQTGYFLILVN